MTPDTDTAPSPQIISLIKWHSSIALDAYTVSESMSTIRDVAGPFIGGRPSRQILADYSPAKDATA